jgi:hypothetical protein
MVSPSGSIPQRWFLWPHGSRIAENLTAGIGRIRSGRMAASQREAMQQLLPWWAKLAHRALVARADSINEVRDEDEVDRHAPGTACIRVRAAIDGDAGT